MSTLLPVCFADIKYCVVCGRATVAKEGKVSCCPQFSVSEKDDCGQMLNGFARDGLMKFCYLCGTDMFIDEDFIFCGNCQETQKFDAPPDITLSDIQHCPLCSKDVRRIKNGVTCGKECRFRIIVSDTKSVMNSLTEYAVKGKVTYCYTCGSEVVNDSLHVKCSRNDCLSHKLSLQQSSTTAINPQESDVSVCKRTSDSSMRATPVVSMQEQKSSYVTVPSLGSMVSRAYQRLSEDATLPMLYKVTCFSVHSDPIKKIEKVEIGPKCLDPAIPSKVLMILGQTGTGKSTLVNAIVNYIFGIKWEDSFRFVLIPESKSQTQSQTQSITAYTFYRVQGSSIDFTLTVIDTPGFGDTRGLERDKELIDQIAHFFSTPKEYGIDHLDGIALTVKAHDSRLTHTQRYIFHSVMSIFGKDVGANIFVMATHADGGRPKVFDALKEEGIPTDKKFVFNNSALYTSPDEVTNFSQMFWEMGLQSIKSFFSEFVKVESKSLTLTKQVLKHREHLEVCIQGLQQKITEGMAKINCLKQEKKLLREHEESINVTKNFTYTVDIPKQRLELLDPGQYVTNCLVCNRTCHFPCGINRDEEKHKCAAMEPRGDPTKAVCKTCPGKCPWNKHVNNPKRFVDYIEKETRTYEDLKKRYHIAKEGKHTKESLVKKITAEKRQLEKEVLSYIEEAHSCLQNLDAMALKPNPLSQVQYIELLIQAEKLDLRIGWQDRVQQYERAKKAAKLMTHIKGQTIEQYLKEAGFTEEDLSDDDINGNQQSKLPKKSQCTIS